MKFLVRNITRGVILADSADLADTSAKRRTGLLKHTELKPGETYDRRIAQKDTTRLRDYYGVRGFAVGIEEKWVEVEPGLVQVHQWHPDPEDSAPEGTVSAHGGVARKAG